MTHPRFVGIGTLLIVLVVFLFVTLRGWHHAAEQDRSTILAGASATHPLGTDALGRDRLERLAMAGLLSFALSCGAAALSTLLAAMAGLAAGSSGVFVRGALLTACDLLTALPWIFLIMIVRGVMPLDTAPLLTTISTYLLLACFGWPACARVVCGVVLSMNKAQWLVHMRAQGASELRLITRHLAPNLLPTLRAQFLITVPAFLIAEVNLGLLGLGTAEPLPSWGGMLRDLQNYGAWTTGPRVQLVPLFALVLVTGSLQLCLLEKGTR